MGSAGGLDHAKAIESRTKKLELAKEKLLELSHDMAALKDNQVQEK